MVGLITPKSVARYTLMPGFIPRLRGLAFNLSALAFYMALVFEAVRILPKGHPFTRPAAFYNLKISEVFAECFRRLKPGYKHLDQYIVFGLFGLGLLLLILQIMAVFAMVLVSNAHAIPFVGLFITVNPLNDVAFMMMDKVFQIPGFFGSQFDPAITGSVAPTALALRILFTFYSYGMLCIAGIILVYYLFVMVVESMQTGEPFGKRFASIYAPIRLVVALMLLLPVYHYLNSGQMLTLYLARAGSGLATNAWLLFNQNAGNNPLGLSTRELVVKPRYEQIDSVIAFMNIARTCQASYKIAYNKDIDMYLVRNGMIGLASGSQLLTSQTFDTALQYFAYRDVEVVFGHKDTANYKDMPGNVRPYCGKMKFIAKSIKLTGVQDVYAAYFDFVKTLWNEPRIIQYGNNLAASQFGNRGSIACSNANGWGNDCRVPDRSFLQTLSSDQQGIFEALIDGVVTNIRASLLAEVNMEQKVLDYGWGGAGVWFNRINSYNGALVSAAVNIPQVSKMPAVMEYVSEQRGATAADSVGYERYNPSLRDAAPISFNNTQNLDVPTTDAEIATLLSSSFESLAADASPLSIEDMKRTNNAFIDYFNSVFGTYGLFELRQNGDVNPLAQMSALGSAIIDRSINYIGNSMVLSGIGGLLSELGNERVAGMGALGAGAQQFSSMFISLATIGLMVGFLLYYVIPLIPFLYFFLAVGRWVKTVFEAMVGIPLWALAHLRIDGEGIPGVGAANGYYLMLEVFIRPILTVFGLVAAATIFSALAIVLNGIFDLVVNNVAGYNPFDAAGNMTFTDIASARHVVDEFFYTCIYAILLYMMALGCFKLIDLIPNSILRFIGSQVSSFADKSGDPAQNLIQYAAYGSYSYADDFARAGSQLTQGVGEFAGGAATLPDRMKPPGAKDSDETWKQWENWINQQSGTKPQPNPPTPPPAAEPPQAQSPAAAQPPAQPPAQPAAQPAAKPQAGQPPAAPSGSGQPTPPPAKPPTGGSGPKGNP